VCVCVCVCVCVIHQDDTPWEDACVPAPLPLGTAEGRLEWR